MDYNHPIIEGEFLKRYKRFFADIQLADEKVVAHVPNTGSLKGICDRPGLCRVQKSSDPKRKLPYTLEQIQTPTSWVGVNTHLPNKLSFEAFTQKQILHWKRYTTCVNEPKLNAETRLDMKFLSGDLPPHFVEIKSVTLAEGKMALFPDAVTMRGQKHLHELIKLTQSGATAEILFILQRTDCDSFAPAWQIDKNYSDLLLTAKKAGVLVSAYSTLLSESRISLDPHRQIKILVEN